MNQKKFYVFPIEEAKRHFEDLSGDFIQEQLTDVLAKTIVDAAKKKDPESLAGEYTLTELLAEFNGDLYNRFRSDTYYIYEQKGEGLKLSKQEINVLEKIARRSKMDTWFAIDDFGKAIDLENTDTKENDVIKTLIEGVTEYDIEELTPSERLILLSLLGKMI